MGNLTTLANVKSYLGGQVDTAGETFVTFAIPYISSVIETYCGRLFGETTYTDEIHDGDGGKQLVLKNYPIISVTSLYDDIDRAWTASTLIAASDYVIKKESGVLYRVDANFFNIERGNIKVTYVAGYKLPGASSGNGTAFPLALEDVCVKLVALAFRDRGMNLGLNSINFEGGTKSFTVDIPEDLKRILNIFRRIMFY